MKNTGPERRRFATVQEANEHAEKFGNRGSYRFGTDSIVFSPTPDKPIKPQSVAEKLAEKKTFDPGMYDPKYSGSYFPGFKK